MTAKYSNEFEEEAMPLARETSVAKASAKLGQHRTIGGNGASIKY